MKIELAQKVSLYLSIFKELDKDIRQNNQQFILDSYFHSQSGFKVKNTELGRIALKTGNLFL